MSTALTTTEKKLFSTAQVDLIKTQIAKDCTNEELALFVSVCERTGLDPFSRQIYAIKRSDKYAPGGKRMVIQTGIDGYRLIADRCGSYAGQDEPVFTYDDSYRVSKATVTVYKLVSGQRCGFAASALMAEYRQQSPLWDRMPHVMLAKCAEAAALRKAFPADLSGLYTQEEMMQADEPAKIANTEPELVTKKTMNQINALVKELGWDAERRSLWAQEIQERFHVRSPKELTQAQGDQIAQDLAAYLAAQQEPAHV